MSAERFFDTNVFFYRLSADRAKADHAEALLAEGGTISVQVLNEFAEVASRKLKMTFAEITEVLTTVREVCRIVPVTLEMHDLALRLADPWGRPLPGPHSHTAPVPAQNRFLTCYQFRFIGLEVR